MNAFAHEPERRKNPRSTMTHDQFQEFTMESLEEGKKQFTEIKSDVAILTGHVTKLTGHIETLASALSENTELTKQTAVLAQKTAEDTADLVRLSQFGKKVSIWGRLTAAFVAGRVRWMSSLSKLLAPILIVTAIATAMYHGDKISWKQILEIVAK